MSGSAGMADRRRLARFWVAAVLAGLFALLAGEFRWPALGLLMAGLAGLIGLAALLQLLRPGGITAVRAKRLRTASRLALLGGIAIAFAAFLAAHLGEHRARIAALCEAQSAQLGDWNLLLNEIAPVSGDRFTALEAHMTIQRGAGPKIAMSPQLRSYFLSPEPPQTASRARLWNGDFSVSLAGFDPARACLAVRASWRPFAAGVQLGSLIAMLGALGMALVALASLNWRVAARERIAMRREDRPLRRARGQGLASDATWPHWRALCVGLILALAVWWALARPGMPLAPEVPAAPVYAAGPTLVAGRQAALEGPANTNRWIVIADAMARRGRFADAAEVLQGAIGASPRNPEGWLALGDALYGHAGGQMSGAAAFAYERAERSAQARGAANSLVPAAMEKSGRSALAQQWRERAKAVRRDNPSE